MSAKKELSTEQARALKNKYQHITQRYHRSAHKDYFSDYLMGTIAAVMDESGYSAADKVKTVKEILHLVDILEQEAQP